MFLEIARGLVVDGITVVEFDNVVFERVVVDGGVVELAVVTGDRCAAAKYDGRVVNTVEGSNVGAIEDP